MYEAVFTCLRVPFPDSFDVTDTARWFDNDIDHYEMAIHDWDHTHEVLRQDYDLDYTTGWDGDFNEHTYVPPDTLVADMRHGEGPDGGGGRDDD